MNRHQATAVGLAAGVALDAIVGDPRRGHPVAGFGRVAGAVERYSYGDTRPRGVAHVLALAGTAAGVGVVATRSARSPAIRAVAMAVSTWAVLGGTTLRREATALQSLLEADDLSAARERLPHLCGRDAQELDASGLARATVESVAENTSDAVVAPLLWGAVAGIPGLLAYRAINTLDAMVGHRSPRYERFGWASARLDDLANLGPSRVTAALTVALAPVVQGRRDAAWRGWRRDGGKHPSPNAGPVEAAFAGALGRTLGGPLAYAGRVEGRPLLGDGPGPTVADIPRAVRLSAAVSLAAAALAVGARGLR